jgi:hypothetical protein
MKRKPIITVIGAASTTFGPEVLRDILNHPEVGGATLRFVDIRTVHGGAPPATGGILPTGYLIRCCSS